MKETEVLRRINDVDPELIEESGFYTKRKRNVWKEFWPFAMYHLLITGILRSFFV